MKYILLFLLISCAGCGHDFVGPVLDSEFNNNYPILIDTTPVLPKEYPGPRTSAAWVTIQHEVNALKKRVDSLTKIVEKLQARIDYGLPEGGQNIILPDTPFDHNGGLQNTQWYPSFDHLPGQGAIPKLKPK